MGFFLLSWNWLLWLKSDDEEAKYFHAFKNLSNYLGQKPSWGLTQRQANHFCYSQPTSQPWVGRKIFLLKPTRCHEGRVSMEYAMWVLARADAQSATELNTCRARDPETSPKLAIVQQVLWGLSGQNLTCVPGNWRAYLNTKNCACLFSEILEEYFLAKPRKVGQKETML